MDPDILHLVREERLLEAAELASRHGDARLASALYERACDWRAAAAEALKAGDGVRALELAAEAGDGVMAEKAIAISAQAGAAGDVAAERLEQRGHVAWAARLLEARGRIVDSAMAWERAGNVCRAAELREQTGDPAGAARVLEEALRRDPQSWKTSLALGALLARFGRHNAAVRVLQRVPPNAPERGLALAYLIPSLDLLGLSAASLEASTEHAALGAIPRPAPATVREAAIPSLFGRYDVRAEVASSPNARVLDCIDVVRRERVAVKLFAAGNTPGLGRDALARFEREARTLQALDHPGIVPLRDYLPEGPALVLAWMPGGTLERLLADAHVMAPARSVEIVAAVLDGLGEAHRLGILHRDIKPSNILFDTAGRARLADFGVAHWSDPSDTATAGVFGTLSYMSPEQREGRPANARSDLFSVGILLREMLTGRQPEAQGASEVLPSNVHRGLDARHDALVRNWTAIDPRERPADAFEARRSLSALPWPDVIDSPAIANPPPSPDRPSPLRLEIRSDGVVVDTWTGRAIERVPLTEEVLARARAFASADHPALQTVLRLDWEARELWLEGALQLPPLGPLSTEDRALLEEAAKALLAFGVAYGSIDAACAIATRDGVALAFRGSAAVDGPPMER